jgi:hypothetical protein
MSRVELNYVGELPMLLVAHWVCNADKLKCVLGEQIPVIRVRG